MAAQIVDFGVLYRFNHRLGNEFHAMVNAGEMLDCVEYQRGAGAEQLAGLGSDD